MAQQLTTTRKSYVCKFLSLMTCLSLVLVNQCMNPLSAQLQV